MSNKEYLANNTVSNDDLIASLRLSGYLPNKPTYTTEEIQDAMQEYNNSLLSLEDMQEIDY